MIDNPLVSPRAVALFAFGFFIYINLKLALFKSFVKHAKNLMDMEKKPVTIKREVSEGEMRAMYEDSNFKKVSNIEYSGKMMKLMYSLSKKDEMSSPPIPSIRNCDYIKKVEREDIRKQDKTVLKVKSKSADDF